MKNKILNKNDFIVANEVTHEEVEAFLLKEIERTKHLLCEATIMNEVLAKSLWYSKIWKKSNLVFSNTSSNSLEE